MKLLLEDLGPPTSREDRGWKLRLNPLKLLGTVRFWADGTETGAKAAVKDEDLARNRLGFDESRKAAEQAMATEFSPYQKLAVDKRGKRKTVSF